MTFRIEISPEAEHDADTILEWLLSEHAGDAGIRWFRGLTTAIESLGRFPERCPLAPENVDAPVRVRQLFYGNSPHVYRILFTIDGDRVYLLHIRHGRRQPVKH